MFVEHQITILDWFLKDRVTLNWSKLTVKTIIMLKNADFLDFLFIIYSGEKKNQFSQKQCLITFFVEQQISILDWFLKDHVTLKTGVMILKIQLCHYKNKNILNQKPVILNYKNISEYYCIFDQINAAFVIIRVFFSFKNIKKQKKRLTGILYIYAH